MSRPQGGRRRAARLLGILLVTLLGTLPSIGGAQAAGVDLQFSGTLIERQCTLAAEDAALAVDLASQSPAFFQHQARTAPVPFELVLKDCPAALLNKQVVLTFRATQTAAVAGVTLMKTQGGTGLLIGLEDATGKPVSPGTPVVAGPVTQVGGENRFRFGAYVQSPGSGAVPEGTYTATATFEVTYQ